MRAGSIVTGSDERIVDTYMGGAPRRAAAFLVAGETGAALIDCGAAVGGDRVVAELRAKGVELDWLLLTHIHLDHAGAAGKVLRAFPGARVGIAARVARHLEQPGGLWAAVCQIYGAETAAATLGRPESVPAGRIVELQDGNSIDLGGNRLEVLATPGHTRHHLSFADSSTGDVYVGDALGVRLPGVDAIRPATPPGDCELDAALESIERIRGLSPKRLWVTHFGELVPVGGSDPGLVLDLAAEALRRWWAGVEDLALRVPGGLAAVPTDEIPAEFVQLVAAEPVDESELEAVSPRWLNLAGITASCARSTRTSGRVVI